MGDSQLDHNILKVMSIFFFFGVCVCVCLCVCVCVCVNKIVDISERKIVNNILLKTTSENV